MLISINFFAHSSIEICPFRRSSCLKLRFSPSPTMSSSCPDTAATDGDVDSRGNIMKFIGAKEATTYDNLLLDGSISNANVRDEYSWSGLHYIPGIGKYNKHVDTDILLYYLLTCDPPADVNGRNIWGRTPMWEAAYDNYTSAVKVLIDFGGDRTIKSYSNIGYCPNMTPLDVAKRENNQDIIQLLMECFPSEE